MSNQKKIVVAMNATLSGQITRAVSNTNKAENARGKAIQGFVEAKWQEGHFWAPSNPDSLATPESWGFLNDAVINGFTEAERALLLGDPEEWKKELDPAPYKAKMKKRRRVMQKVTARIADFRKGVVAAHSAKGSGRKPGRKRLPDQRVMEELAELIKFLKTLDPTDRVASNGLNVEGVKKLLEDAFKLAKG